MARARILLVEDDPGTARLVQRRLEGVGHTVATADSAAAAMEQLRGQGVDLILLDNRLPGATGLDFYRELRASGCDLPAILMTGFTNEEIVITALRVGMRDFIPKGPQFIDYLPQAVEQVLKQVELEQRLANFEQRLAGIIKAATDGIVSFEPDGKITLFNPAAEQLFGCTAAEAIGQSIENLFPDRLSLLAPRGDGASTSHRAELSACRPDGRTFQADVTRFEVQAGGAHFTTLIIADASERHRAEEERMKLAREQAARAEAEAASQAKDVFLATLSHELRTPLATVLGWVRLLRIGQLDVNQQARALETIERNAQHQASLIEELLDVSRIVSGKLQLDRRTLDLNVLTKEVVEGFRNEAEANRIELQLKDIAEPLFVDGDRTRLKQVLSNLLGNALKFTPPGGRISVALEQRPARARVVVADNGAGIAAELLPRIFEPFKQGDEEQYKIGLGLGLSIARRLVEAHDGCISAQSCGAGQGATLIVELPAVGEVRPPAVSGEPLPAEAGRSEGYPALDGLRILVVEDDADTREFVEFVLAARRAEVKSAGSVNEALAILRGFRADVIVTDLAMPGGDGYSLLNTLRELKHTFGQAPVLAFTAHASMKDRQRALAAGFRAYIAKPVDPFELIDVVSKVHESSRV